MEKDAYELRQKILTIDTKNNSNFTDESIESNSYYNDGYTNNDSDYNPTNLHHSCGELGTSCRRCYDDPQVGWCGCVLVAYKCCCGSYVGGKEIFCEQHY